MSVTDRVFHSVRPSRRRRKLLATLALASAVAASATLRVSARWRANVIRAPLTAPEAGPSVEDLFSAGRTPIVTGWEDTPWRLESQECARCHAATHEAWSESMHARAWTDPLFQASYVREPLAWCRNCHAPLSAQESGAVPREQGISCAACHVRAGEIGGLSRPAQLDELARGPGRRWIWRLPALRGLPSVHVSESHGGVSRARGSTERGALLGSTDAEHDRGVARERRCCLWHVPRRRTPLDWTDRRGVARETIRRRHAD